ncbi:MAG: hypothetical protein KBT34_14235 [Prevotella sp.]|nr:hypothetical protein [Candidatus Prevotella equi]
MLDSEFGAPGTASRLEAEKKAEAYYEESEKWHTVTIPMDLYRIISKKAKEKGVSVRAYTRQALASVLL